MTNFWDSEIWGTFNVFAVVLLSLLAANALKHNVKFLRDSLIPTSVFGGSILLVFAGLYDLISGKIMFETSFFGGNGYMTLEVITYHALALGFIASSFKSAGGRLSKKRVTEIVDTGVTTVSTYLIQAIFGLSVTLITSLVLTGFFPAAGVLLPFGYGQGTGQALNYGNIYETQFGFAGGKSFGLTIAALGFLSASIGGVIHLNVLKKKGKVNLSAAEDDGLGGMKIQSENEIPWQGSIDKLTVQIALVAVSYLLAYLMMFFLGKLLPGLKAVVYGFNFLIGVLCATLVKLCISLLKKSSVVKKEYVNDFLMTRVSNFCFDVMVVAGIAAIRLGLLENYWGVIAILGLGGLLITFFYDYLVARLFFRDYAEEQFLMMYGMLTGTASTGTILLREIDRDFRTPAADNMVYQNFPAILLGFPMMLLATLAPEKPILTLVILIAFFAVLNLYLFRTVIFRKRRKKE